LQASKQILTKFPTPTQLNEGVPDRTSEIILVVCVVTNNVIVEETSKPVYIAALDVFDFFARFLFLCIVCALPPFDFS
jgi:hypothetical protein